MWIHNKINPHAGVETTIREVSKKMRIPKGLRRLVKKITQDCVKCKIKMKKVSAVKMSTYSEARTVLAPPEEKRGRVERKIRSLKESLERMGVNTNHPQTVLQWESLFSKIANTVDNLPMAKGSTTNAKNLGYEIITPNRLKLGQNNYLLLEGSGIKLDMSLNLITLLERNCELYCEWYRIFIENIHMLDLRPNKWLKNKRLPVIDDIVLFVFNDSEYGKGGMDWRLGKIT